ncbi:hypothetical protein EJ08DRAFT_726123 [Tothia fuscella]|uniref:Uncharacterized protein n=1 Tax=Tothia fuscella TaxID=1048955 RepID=A0A9P4TUL9_9PEZI|nr:hypothetical protein EJ08DRAFT_726123 [Tothia fuscella]
MPPSKLKSELLHFMPDEEASEVAAVVGFQLNFIPEDKRLTELKKTLGCSTNFVTLTAIIGRALVRARWPQRENSSSVKLEVVVNIRRAPGLNLPNDYMGNATLYNFARSLPLNEICGGSSTENDVLSRMAKSVQRAIGETKERDWLLSRLYFLKKHAKGQPGRVRCGLNFKRGLDVMITDWRGFGKDLEFQIGDQLIKPDYVRKRYSADNGGVIVLPREKDSDVWEVLVGVKTECASRLLEDLSGFVCKAVE